MRATLPVRVTEQRQEPANRESQERAWVLVIDDVESSRDALSSAIAALGHRVSEAASVAEALEHLCGDCPDLILLDLNMPGPEITERSRVLRARLGATPRIFVMTAGVVHFDPKTLSAHGVDSFVQKPISIDTLARLIEGRGIERATPEPTPGSEFDEARLVELGSLRTSDGRSLGDRIARRLSRDADALRARIEIATAKGEPVCDLLHELAGLAAVLGASEAKRRLVALEDLARAGVPEPPGEALRMLDAMCAGFLEHFPEPELDHSTVT